jgi:uncharacterized protein YndB with AHSA1/START domain
VSAKASEAVVSSGSATGRDLVITRVYDAPRALVFDAWTRPRHFARWFGPRGSTLPFCEMDVRPGGTLRFCHCLPGGDDIWVKGTYRDVVAPERLVFTVTFTDPAGNQIERPGFPRETRIAVTFAEQQGRTTVTVRHSGLVRDQGELLGWTESLDRLEALYCTVFAEA